MITNPPHQREVENIHLDGHQLASKDLIVPEFTDEQIKEMRFATKDILKITKQYPRIHNFVNLSIITIMLALDFIVLFSFTKIF